jgi:hypothetical protein
MRLGVRLDVRAAKKETLFDRFMNKILLLEYTQTTIFCYLADGLLDLLKKTSIATKKINNK